MVNLIVEIVLACKVGAVLHVLLRASKLESLVDHLYFRHELFVRSHGQLHRLLVFRHSRDQLASLCLQLLLLEIGLQEVDDSLVEVLVVVGLLCQSGYGLLLGVLLKILADWVVAREPPHCKLSWLQVLFPVEF